jgi:lipid-binding SYLF domain-containing protein
LEITIDDKEKIMRRALSIMVLVSLCALALWAVDNTKVLDAATQTVQSMTTGAKPIPSSLLRAAKCIAVVPKLTKAGFIVGGEHGNGVVSCRTATGWSAPAFITITGGSVGLQAGGEHQEIVLLMNNQGKQELTNGHWDLGAEAVAAGPTGDSAGVGESTGWKAPVLSYAHSSGAYAGANLQGSKIDLDQDANHNLYGKSASIQSVLEGQVQTPEAAQQFLSALDQAAGK